MLCSFPAPASFVAPPTGGTLFAGIYTARRVGTVDASWIDPLHLVPGVQLTRGELDSYETARASELEAFIGRLWINWGAGARSWVQRPDRQNKPIVRLWKRKLQSRAMGLNKN